MISQKMKLATYAVVSAVAGVVGLVMAGFVSAATTLIDLPSTAVADISEYRHGSCRVVSRKFATLQMITT